MSTDTSPAIDTHVGPMPSGIGEMTSGRRLPYAKPKTFAEQMQEQYHLKSLWESQQEQRRARRERLAKELQEAEGRALKAASELPVAEARKKDLLSPEARNSEEHLMHPEEYARKLRFADNHIRDLQSDLRAPEKIRERIARMDAELEPDELALVSAWNEAGEDARRLLLKMIGLRLVDTNEIRGTQVNIANALPTTKG